MPCQSQQLLTPGLLLDAKGRLHQAGYATSLVKVYHRSAVGASPLRLKEWDYYCITCGGAVLALTIADNGYMGLDSVSLLDLNENRQHTWSAMRILPLGRTGLPSTSQEGDVAVKRDKYELCFHNDGTRRLLTIRVDDFQDGKPLTAQMELTEPPRDSMVIATPFKGHPRAFYYNQKINCLKAEGFVEHNGRTYLFDPHSATAVLDWGRGVWTYANTWYWASASGYIHGQPFGMNLGYGFGDTSAATENMLFYRGEAHKLEHVDFGMPEDRMAPWHITDDHGRLDLVFTPVMDRASLTSAVVLESDQHQVFGHFEGKAVLDDGTELHVCQLTGFAEKVRNRW